MMEHGVAHGMGIDPSCLQERAGGAAAERITVINDYYSEAYAHLDADAVVCRHTLEHIHRVGEFIRIVRHSLRGRPDTVVLFELPDVRRVLREVAFWDIYYEHCSYFTPGSLGGCTGDGVRGARSRLDYDDQYILIEGRPADGPVAGPHRSRRSRATSPRLSTLRGRLRGDARPLARPAPERAGRRPPRGDLGRRLEGRRLPDHARARRRDRLRGGHQPAQARHVHGRHRAADRRARVPAEHRPELVVAMNPVYLDEIGGELSSLGVEASSLPSERTPCPVCGSAGASPVLQVEGVPVFCNVLWDTREAARRRPAATSRSRSAGPADRSTTPRSTPNWSATARPTRTRCTSRRLPGFAHELAGRLVERYDLHGKNIVDIGCGNGDFLRMLCDATGNRGVGFDPSYRGAANGNGSVRFVREYFSPSTPRSRRTSSAAATCSSTWTSRGRCSRPWRALGRRSTSRCRTGSTCFARRRHGT